MTGAAGRSGLRVEIGGVALGGVVDGSIRIARRFGVVETAEFEMRGRLADLTIPTRTDVLWIVDNGPSYRVLFAGRPRHPAARAIGTDGYAALRIVCVGIEQRLHERIIGPELGIRVLAETTGRAQVRLVASDLDWEGDGIHLMLSASALVIPIEGDIRWLTAAEFLRRVVAANDEVLWARYDYIVDIPGCCLFLESLQEPRSSGHTLSTASLKSFEIHGDEKDYRSHQVVRLGDVLGDFEGPGDGSAREWRLAPPTGQDYLAADVTATAEGDGDPDRGVRFAGAATTTAQGQTVGFFRFAGAPDAASTLYLGDTAVIGTGWRLILRGLDRHFRLVPDSAVLPQGAEQYGLIVSAGSDDWRLTGPGVISRTEAVRDATRDIHAASGGSVSAAFSDATHLWLVRGPAPYACEAWDTATVTRDASRDITLPASISNVSAAVTVGGTLWVAGGQGGALGETVFAFALADGARDTSRDFTAARAAAIRGMATDGGHIYVLYHLTDPEVWEIESYWYSSQAYVDRWTDRLPSAVTRWRSLVCDGDTLWAVSGEVSPRAVALDRHEDMARDASRDIALSSAAVFGGAWRRDVLWFARSGQAPTVEAWCPPGQRLTWDVTAAQYAAILAATPGAFAVRVIDEGVRGASVADARYGYPAPLTVDRVEEVTVDGEVQSVGGPTDDWAFDLARQSLRQVDTAPVLTAAQTLAARFRARWIVESEEDGAALRVDRVDDLPDATGLALPDALAAADLVRTQHSHHIQRLHAQIVDSTLHIEPGETVLLDVDLARAFGVADPDAADRWLVTEVVVSQRGNLLRYQVVAQRGSGGEERFAEFWRDLLRR